MQVGDTVRINSKYYRTTKGIIIKQSLVSRYTIEWIVQPFDRAKPIICSQFDLEIINESR